MRILIVEDEIKIRTGISRLITMHTGHTVVGEAKNGKEGLEMIERFHPELVISDIRMPVMDGLEMAETAVKTGQSCHFVILSGYSEFEYAQKAIRNGVDDYLLKPLAPEDVTDVLDKIQKKIAEEETEQAQTTEGLLRNMLLGEKKNITENCRRLEKSGAVAGGKPLCLLAGYLGNTSTNYQQALVEQWKNMKERYPELHLYCVMLENTQEMFVLIQTDIEVPELLRKLSRRLYLNTAERDQPVWGCTLLDRLEDIETELQTLRDFYLYGIRIGYRELLTAQKVRAIPEREFQYPIHLEPRMQAAICGGSADSLKKEAERFQSYVKAMGCHPRYVRKTYKKMLAYLESVCHEVNPEAYRLLQRQDLERAASEMLTSGELEACFEKAIRIILESKDKKEDIRNYAIRRAINFIREHYSENISLDLLADKLEITPEYLSALFNKEVGINFSTFLKRFRISQAKRLLRGTDAKIYTVARQVGYHDPKYFNRVFKEEIGVSPGDYRQKN